MCAQISPVRVNENCWSASRSSKEIPLLVLTRVQAPTAQRAVPAGPAIDVSPLVRVTPAPFNQRAETGGAIMAQQRMSWRGSHKCAARDVSIDALAAEWAGTRPGVHALGSEPTTNRIVVLVGGALH